MPVLQWVLPANQRCQLSLKRHNCFVYKQIRDMSPETLIYTLLYLMFSACVIYPPIEFISSGVTIPTLFSSLLGSESEQFIVYHIKRSILTLFIYSLLPLGYIVGLWFFNYSEEVIF